MHIGIGLRGAAALCASTAFVVASTSVPAAAADHEDARAAVQALQSSQRAVGSALTYRDDSGDWTVHSGSGRSGAKQDIQPTDQYRVGSQTKMFTAAIVLQLVDEGKIDLDSPIGEYLPGVVEGDGLDDSRITVRHLLQHTSGVRDYTDGDPTFVFNPVYQWNPPTAEHLVAMGTAKGAAFAPGEKFKYVNIEYAILGMMVEKVDGRPMADAVKDRIVEPLGLRNTWRANRGQKQINGAHVSGYLGVPPAIIDATGHEPGLWPSAGDIVSTQQDMLTFTRALLSGDVVPNGLLAEMKKPYSDSQDYGLGLYPVDLSCGTAWGHNGAVPGYASHTVVMDDGSAATVMTNSMGVPLITPELSAELVKPLDAALCGTD